MENSHQLVLTSNIDPNGDGHSCPGRLTDKGTHYLIRGHLQLGHSQSVIVCVHGIGSYHSCFNRLAEFFVQKGYIVVQYDLIGRGYSLPSHNQKYGREEHISQLHDLLTDISAELPAEPYHFICHSMGGSLGTLFTNQYPDFVKSLVLLSPAGLMSYFPVGILVSLPKCFQSCISPLVNNPASQKKAVQGGFYRKSLPEVQKLMVDTVNDLAERYKENPESRNAFWRSALEFPLRNIDNEVMEIGKRKDFPVLLLWGDHDTDVPINPSYSRWKHYLNSDDNSSAQMLNQERCHLESKVYENAGHSFFEEYNTIVAEDIHKFLQQF